MIKLNPKNLVSSYLSLLQHSYDLFYSVIKNTPTLPKCVLPISDAMNINHFHNSNIIAQNINLHQSKETRVVVRRKTRTFDC